MLRVLTNKNNYKEKSIQPILNWMESITTTMRFLIAVRVKTEVDNGQGAVNDCGPR